MINIWAKMGKMRIDIMIIQVALMSIQEREALEPGQIKALSYHAKVIRSST